MRCTACDGPLEGHDLCPDCAAAASACAHEEDQRELQELRQAVRFRDIASAPRDGREIIVAGPVNGTTWIINNAWWIPARGWWSPSFGYQGGFLEGAFMPTHWAPVLSIEERG